MGKGHLHYAPRRGLPCPDAAAYIGLGQTKFLQLVAEKRMPLPVRIDSRTVWDIRDLDEAFEAFKDAVKPATAEPAEPTGVDASWDDITP